MPPLSPAAWADVDAAIPAEADAAFEFLARFMAAYYADGGLPGDSG